MDSDAVDALLDQANDLSVRGNHHEAIAIWEKVRSEGPNWVGLNLGNSYQAIGDVAAARIAFEESWLAGCDDAGFNLAELYRSEGKLTQARIIDRRLIQKSYVKAMIAEAEDLRAEGNLAGAQDLLARAIDDEGADGDRAAGILGYLLWSSTHSVAAEPLLRRGQNEYPTARADLAEVLMKLGRLSEAISILEEGVELGEAESMLPLANIWASLDNEDAAESLYRRGYALGDAFAAFNLGVLRWESGRKKSARKWIARAAEGGDAEAQVWLQKQKKNRGS
jgi:tetratricopeptide (TPR) repeat protein